MGIFLVVLAVIAAVLITLTIFGLVWWSDAEADQTLSREKRRLDVKSLYGYRYDETPEEKRKRLGAPVSV